MSEETLGLLMRELRLEPNDVDRTNGLLALGGLWSIAGLDRPELKEEPWKPSTQTRLISVDDEGAPDLFGVIAESDVLVQHPYDSFDTPPGTRTYSRSSRRCTGPRPRRPES